MKVTDYIIEYLISKGITDIFGYPGGVICHLIDSATKYKDQISIHTNYHEQASAFAACGYAQRKCNVGVAFSTSGPGATNLATGIANAYFDSIPTVFLTGQVDTYALKGNMMVRQRGFQETDVVAMYRSITKYSIRIDNPNDIPFEVEKAFYYAISGNPGPVLIDLPADVQRADINVKNCKKFNPTDSFDFDYGKIIDYIVKELNRAKRPCLLIGNGVKQSGCREDVIKLVNAISIPTVSSMPAVDLLPFDNSCNFGFIGANGHRYANFVLGKSDLILSLGSRLDLKQVGNNRNEFAPNSKIIRVDIDDGNFENKLNNTTCIKADIKQLINGIVQNNTINVIDASWLLTCKQIKEKLLGFDNTSYTEILKEVLRIIPNGVSITADVGQHEVWIAQQIEIKDKQTLHLSAGHGSMGYSLPAAIGVYYASRKPVYCFAGDGGIQMNIQELQFLSREQIPVCVIIINNNSLGMIRGFQEANFNGNYSQTTSESGYTVPNFELIANAYGLSYRSIKDIYDISRIEFFNDRPSIIEVKIQNETRLMPNFGHSSAIQDQRPYIDRELYNELMKL